MTDNMETEIRRALDARAHEIEVPEDLAVRTVENARAREATTMRDRARAWRDGRRSRARMTAYPRVLYAGGAAATAVLLFVIGALVTRPPTGVATDVAGPPAVMEAQDGVIGSVSAGQTAATVQDNSLTNRSQDANAEQAGDDSGAGTTAIEPAPPVPAPPVPAPGSGKLPPKIVRTANIEVEVESFEPAWSRANTIATRYGGFVTNSSTEQVEDRLGRGSLVMRVAAAKLDAALADLRKLGTLANMSTSGDDISAPIADVKARLRTLQTQELQLLDLMTQAKTLSETLEVRSQLDSVRQEIESYKAQRDAYEDQVAYSTINATIFEEGIDRNGGGGDGVLRDAMETALRIGLTIVAGTVVVLGGLIPLVALALAIWFVVRALRKRAPRTD